MKQFFWLLLATFFSINAMDKDAKKMPTGEPFTCGQYFEDAVRKASMLRLTSGIHQTSPPERKNAAINACDQANAQALKIYIGKVGWPTVKKGALICYHATLIALQADHDITFQKKCLYFMEQTVAAKKFPPIYFAYLADRILVNERKSQIYGTYIVAPQLPLFTERELDNINKQRKEIGLCSMQKTIHGLFKQELERPKQSLNFFNNCGTINPSPC